MNEALIYKLEKVLQTLHTNTQVTNVYLGKKFKRKLIHINIYELRRRTQ